MAGGNHWTTPVRTILILLGVCGMLLAADLPGVWLDVPFVKQEKDGCGAASIAMVMQYWQQQRGQAATGFRRDTDPAPALLRQSSWHLRLRHGTLLQGKRIPYIYNSRRVGRPAAAPGQRTSVDCGVKPVGGGISLHYVVVTGLDQEQGVVMVNDPAQRKLLKQDRSVFEQEWSAAERWTLLAVPQTPSR